MEKDIGLWNQTLPPAVLGGPVTITTTTIFNIY